jgi:hypothetical protein
VRLRSEHSEPHGDPPRVLSTELVAVSELKEHPRNYRAHGDDQREHLQASMQAHGVYRNVVIAQDGTLLAGHGVVDAARAAGVTQVPAVRLPLAPDDPRAIAVLVGDNEVMRLALADDRLLSELLREVRDSELMELLGTGYDDQMLANLVFVTRHADEIADRDDAAAWVGMPSFEPTPDSVQCLISFDSAEDRQRLLDQLGITAVYHREHGAWSVWWPPRARELDVALRFAEAEA